MIKNRQYRIERSRTDSATALLKAADKLATGHVLRWYIGEASKEAFTIEATTFEGELELLPNSAGRCHYPGKSVAVNVIPTGVGCEIGGYAGDAAAATNLLATSVDYLVTNPNAVNASDFIYINDNVVYTEGASIDLFCQGAIDLYLPYSNRIGVIIERAETWKLDAIFDLINTARAVHGVDIAECVVTDKPIGSRCIQNQTGAFVGTVDNPDVLLESCEKLIRKGANAIAITTDVQDLPPDKYARHFAGEYPNPVGGVEAVISHLITRKYHVPAAHAPLINVKQLDLDQRVVDARGAGEFSSVSGLACVLIGLRRAPQIKPDPKVRVADIINVNNWLAVIAPATCLGGIPMIYAQKYGVPILAVRENRTILDVTQEKLQLNNVIEVQSYAEAAGVISALKKGINLQSITRPLQTFRYAQ